MSKPTTEIQKRDTALPAEVPEASNLLEVIARAVCDPRMDVEKMERLLVMHQTITAEQHKVAFMAALGRLQAKLPQIQKSGRIIINDKERMRYAKLEDIDVVIRPLLSDEGFAFSFDSESTDGKLFKLSCTLARKGHSETKYLLLPLDASDYRSNVQSIGSTVSYGKRQLIKMHLNLIERDEDDDGNGGAQPISADQIKDLETMIQDSKANKAKFLEFMGVERLDDILKRQYEKAVNALQVKKRQQ